MADPQTNPETWAAAILATVPGIAAFLKWRGATESLHSVRNIAQNALLKASVVETQISGLTGRLDRIEDKIDRLLEQRP